MIVHLAGTLRAKDSVGCVIDCHGVGYGVEMSLASIAVLGAIGSPCAAHIYTHVAEDQLRLYGFVQAEERAAFVSLLSAAGVGPKLALTILSTLTTSELCRVVEARDHAALTRVPGVGRKKAERLLLDLQGKLKAIAGFSTVAAKTSGSSSPHALPAGKERVFADVTSALLHLGFAQADASQAAHRVLSGDGPTASVGELVRLALQALAPRA